MTIGLARRAAATVAVLALGLAGAGTAAADTSASSNWAGYAVHRAGVRFRTVAGSWTQPRATCTGGRAGYSAVWVGIGGYSVSSPALEQIGTELDCTASGHVTSSAWYELVPAASHTTTLIVGPGDRVRASVTVDGNAVKLAIADLTRRRSFTRTLHSTVLDTGSAEWILEAPSICSSVTDCKTLPLADFGSAQVTGARATTTAGHTGFITDRRWATSEISLAPGSPGFGSDASTRPVLAAPSSLRAGGSAFTISYNGTSSAGAAPASATRRAAALGRLVHVGR